MMLSKHCGLSLSQKKMEQLSEIISMIGGGVSSVVLPLLGVLLFYDSKQRKANAEARKAEMDNLTGYAEEWKGLYEQRDKRVDSRTDRGCRRRGRGNISQSRRR